MTRNIDERIEVSTPVYDKQLKQMVIAILSLQFKDNTKSRVINQQHDNRYNPRGNKRKLRSQVAIHQYLNSYEKKVKTALAVKHNNKNQAELPQEA